MDFNFTKFENDKRNLLLALSQDPRRFAIVLYVERITGIFSRVRETFSNYITTNYQPLCCLIGAAFNATKCPDMEVTECGVGKEGNVCLVNINSNKYVFKTRVLPTLDLRYSNTAPTPLITGPSLSPSCISRDVANQSYLSCDDFTNEFLIAYIMESIYTLSGGTTAGLKGFAKHYTVTVCDVPNSTLRYGLNLIEYSDLGDVVKFINTGPLDVYKELKEFSTGTSTIRQQVLTVATILDISKQLIANLHFLQLTADYTHGDLKANNVTVKTEKVNINYLGMTHSSNICVKLIDFGRSSIRVNLDGTQHLRVYNRNFLGESLLSILPFRPSSENFFNEPYYTINDISNLAVLSRIRNSGSSFYTSFDTYTVFTSLLCLPGIFYQVFGSNTLRNNIFDIMFFPDDTTKMFDRIRNAAENRVPPSYDNVLTILNGIKLKCRLTSLLFDSLKK